MRSNHARKLLRSPGPGRGTPIAAPFWRVTALVGANALGSVGVTVGHIKQGLSSELIRLARVLSPPTFPDLLSEVFNSPGEGEPPPRKNCSGFLRHLSDRLGVQLVGLQADNQIDYMEHHWKRFKDAKEAVAYSRQSGWLVAVVLKSTAMYYDPNDKDSKSYRTKRTHGHVGIIYGGFPPQTDKHAKYPRIWCGDYPSGSHASAGDKTVGDIFRVKDRDRVNYFGSPVYPEVMW